MLLTASRIHDGHTWLPIGTVMEVDDDGRIVALHDSTRQEDAYYYDGILCPGFVNVHCHMELSHMMGKVPEHTGLIPFLQQVTFHRNEFTEEEKQTARHAAYDELLHNGIVATGDIANGDETLDIRSLDKMHVHTFVECIGFTETLAQQRFGFSEKIYDSFAAQERKNKVLAQSIIPHAPYSLSASLFKLIDAHDKKALISIHNQESIEETKFYTDKTGAVNDLLNGFNIDTTFFTPSGRSSLQTYLHYFSPSHPFIFVHNTYTTKEDIVFAQSKMPEVYWCLCPNANKYIEDRLPDLDLLLQDARNICIGTDSLASNHQLCILSELHTIKERYPGIEWGLLLRWATSGGAAALQMQNNIGSIEIGKSPGILQITGIEDATNKPVVKRLL